LARISCAVASAASAAFNVVTTTAAPARQRQRDRPSDIAGAAGYDRNSVFKVHLAQHHRLRHVGREHHE
jgi:hypothetical protein